MYCSMFVSYVIWEYLIRAFVLFWSYEFVVFVHMTLYTFMCILFLGNHDAMFFLSMCVQAGDMF